MAYIPPKKSNWLEITEHDLLVFPPEAYGPPPQLPAFNEWNVGLLPYVVNCIAFGYNAPKPDVSKLEVFGHYRISIPNPGYMSGNPMKSIGPENLRDAMISDGFIYVPRADQNLITVPKDHFLVAAYSYYHPLAGANIHLYRKHDDWYQKLSHGFGWDGFITNISRSGELLTDPQKDKMIVGPRPGQPSHYQFAGFFLAKNEGVNLDIQITPLPPVPRDQIHWPLPNI